MDGATQGLYPSEDFIIFLDIFGIDKAWRFLVATSSAYVAYQHAIDF